MKTTFAILTMLIGEMFSQLIAQEFAPIGAEWYYSSMADGSAPPNSEYYFFKCIKDTTINNHLLKKIDITYFRYQGDSVVLKPYFISQIQDTVSLYNSELNKFYKIFAFNVNQGDTLLLDIPYEVNSSQKSTYRVIIEAVLTETFDNTKLKKYLLKQIDQFGWYNGFYLEKVGGYSWFLPLGLVVIPEVDGPIRCYHDNLININFSGDKCDKRIISSINEINNEKIKIYPNPTMGEIRIETDIEINRIDILDMSGKKLLESQNRIINIYKLAKGFYILNLNSNKEKIYKVLIKI